MKFFYIFLFGFGFLLTSCTAGFANGNNGFIHNFIEANTGNENLEVKLETSCEIIGSILNKPNTMIILSEATPESLIFMDSIRTDKTGKFKIKKELKGPLLCQLQWGQTSSLLLVLEPGSFINLGLDPQATFNTYNLSGKKIDATIELKKLLDLNTSYYTKIQALQTSLNGLSQTDPNSNIQAQQLQKEYTTVYNERGTVIRKFAMEAKPSLIPYFVVSFGFLEENDVELLKKAAELTKLYSPNSKYDKSIQKLLTDQSLLGIGTPAPDFNLTQPDGTKLALSSLKGKVVLIDFWASWCGPCRKENPNVVRMYNKFKEKGFEILGVSLDSDGSAWKAAIAKDGLTWKHVSELKGWEGPVNRQYKVSSIPYTLLIDAKGNILAKNLRGEQLELKLAEVLN